MVWKWLLHRKRIWRACLWMTRESYYRTSAVTSTALVGFQGRVAASQSRSMMNPSLSLNSSLSCPLPVLSSSRFYLVSGYFLPVPNLLFWFIYFILFYLFIYLFLLHARLDGLLPGCCLFMLSWFSWFFLLLLDCLFSFMGIVCVCSAGCLDHGCYSLMLSWLFSFLRIDDSCSSCRLDFWVSFI